MPPKFNLISKKNYPIRQNLSQAIPLWIWFLIGGLIIAIGIIWTLREEDNPKPKVAKRVSPPDSFPEIPTPIADISTSTYGAALSEEIESEETTQPPEADDLTRIKGIGPKIEKTLHEHGIYTFAQLAATEVAFLAELMQKQGWSMATYATWPEQAQLL